MPYGVSIDSDNLATNLGSTLQPASHALRALASRQRRGGKISAQENFVIRVQSEIGRCLAKLSCFYQLAHWRRSPFLCVVVYSTEFNIWLVYEEYAPGTSTQYFRAVNDSSSNSQDAVPLTPLCVGLFSSAFDKFPPDFALNKQRVNIGRQETGLRNAFLGSLFQFVDKAVHIAVIMQGKIESIPASSSST
jgi:hypothetical protein